jgi:hypothetical protein
MQWGAMGPAPYGTRGLGKSTPRPVRNKRQFSDSKPADGTSTLLRSVLPVRGSGRQFLIRRALMGPDTRAFSSPRLAGARLGSRRSETGLFEIGF